MDVHAVQEFERHLIRFIKEYTLSQTLHQPTQKLSCLVSLRPVGSYKRK